MVPLLAAGAALGVGGNIVSLIGSAGENAKRQKLINQRRMDIQNWFDKDYNQDFLNTSENRSAIKNISDRIKEKQLSQSNTNAIMGGSDEAITAEKGQNGRVYADFVNNLAAKATDVKQKAKDNYYKQIEGVDASQQALNTERGNNWVNFGKMANVAGGALMQAGSMGGTIKPGTTLPGSGGIVDAPGGNFGGIPGIEEQKQMLG